METKSHFYITHIHWTAKRRGCLSADDLPDLTVSTPPEFKGEAGYWTPEHLFVAAAEACLMATFLGIAANSHLAVTAYRSSALGTLEWVNGRGWRFVEIAIFPEVELESPEDCARANSLMTKAENGCLIANSMTARLRTEPQFAVRTVVAV